MPRIRDAPLMSNTKGLLVVLLAVSLMAFLTSGHHPCQDESIKLLERIIQRLGNSSDAELYTPDNFTVRIFYRGYILEEAACYARNLECFHLELTVIEEEEEEHRVILSRLISRLGRLRPRQNCTDPRAQCRPCECHPEQPVPFFLRELLRMLQWSCREEIVPCVARQRGAC
ncbi:UNVERIFIED_CONTAM: hypothetical protein K2H54_036532 [Gekko kuhli]